MTSDRYGPRELTDPDVPNAARAYDYFLGGSASFAADREFADQVLRIAPSVPAVARLNRSFLHRVVNYLLDRGVTQFLDLGSGIPTVGNVHEIAQRRVPDARVVYVDYEPVAHSYARQLLRDNPHADVVHADLRDVSTVLSAEPVRRLLDLDRPLGLLIVGVLLYIGDADAPAELMARYAERLAPGSFLAMSHIAVDRATPELADEVGRLTAAYAQAGEPVYVRGHDEMERWFDGMELVEPGFVFLPDWHPDDDAEQSVPARVLGYGGVARIG